MVGKIVYYTKKRRKKFSYRRLINKLSNFWYKVILKKLGLFKRYKQPIIDYSQTLECLARNNFNNMSQTEIINFYAKNRRKYPKKTQNDFQNAINEALINHLERQNNAQINRRST